MFILSSRGANQLQVVYIRTLGNIQRKFTTKVAVLKCIPSNFFLELWRSFRTTSQKLALENHFLAYHTVDKDDANILYTVFPSFCVCVFFLSYVNRNYKDSRHP